MYIFALRKKLLNFNTIYKINLYYIFRCFVMLCGMLQISMTPSMKRVLEKVFLQSQSFSKNTKTIMTLKEKRLNV